MNTSVTAMVSHSGQQLGKALEKTVTNLVGVRRGG